MKWGAAVFAAVVLAGTGLFFWIVIDDEIKFASVADEEELVDALIENFSTGQESVNRPGTDCVVRFLGNIQ